MYVNPIFWAAVCGAWGTCSRYMGRNSNMHRVEVHGAAMYNEWTAEPLEDEEKWMIFFFPDISHASVSCIFYWPCLLGLLLAWGARQMLHVPPLCVCVCMSVIQIKHQNRACVHLAVRFRTDLKSVCRGGWSAACYWNRKCSFHTDVSGWTEVLGHIHTDGISI